MPSERSAGLVVFKLNGQPSFVILEYGRGHWGFPKGNIEAGENEKEAAIRETMEETGLTDLKFVDDYRESIEYYYRQAGRTIHKEVVYFLAETKRRDVKLSSEHVGFEWLTFEDALNRLNHENDRNILRKAFLKIS